MNAFRSEDSPAGYAQPIIRNNWNRYNSEILLRHEPKGYLQGSLLLAHS